MAPLAYAKENWGIILLNGAIVYLVSKLLWYKGFRFIDISKAISIGMAMPAISLVYAAAFSARNSHDSANGGICCCYNRTFVFNMEKKGNRN